MLVIGISLFTFVGITTLIVALWWWVSSSAAMRARLTGQAELTAPSPGLLRESEPEHFHTLLRVFKFGSFVPYLNTLTAQAGLPNRTGDTFAWMVALGLVSAAISGFRTGQLLWIIVGGLVGAWLPVLYLQRRRNKRLEKFGEQFPDALDMLTRALQAGHAIGGALQVVAEEMPDPVGVEFRQVFQQVSLGRPPEDAVKELHQRIGSEDVRFFRAAVGIQREVGGNLAEILKGLSEVIRDRFRVLSYARVLSAQHRMSAYFVAASPMVMAIIFTLMDPEFFTPLLENPLGTILIGAAVILQVIGFIVLKRVATITV